MFRILFIIILAVNFSVVLSTNFRRQISVYHGYLPRCKYDEPIIRNNDHFSQKIKNAQVVFTGKVTSDVIVINNNTVQFSVIVKRYFKNSLGWVKNKELWISKTLNEGEGVRCRQPVRVKYTAIFIGRKPQRMQDVDVVLTLSPVPVTLNNLDRVSAATKGKAKTHAWAGRSSIKIKAFSYFTLKTNTLLLYTLYLILR